MKKEEEGMKSVSSRQAIKKLNENGWWLKRVTGDHYQFTNGINVTTVQHPVKDLSKNDIKSLEKQTGIKLR